MYPAIRKDETGEVLSLLALNSNQNISWSRSSQLFDELFGYNGLDERDLTNFTHY